MHRMLGRAWRGSSLSGPPRSQYSFERASDYWIMAPTAHQKINTKELAQKSSEEIVSVWTKGLQDKLAGWDQRGYLPLLDRYKGMFQGKTILKIGCGLGFEHIHFFAPLVERSFLCDIVPSNVDVVSAVLGNLKYTKSEAALIDYDRPADFPPVDFMYSNGVMHHIPFEICRDKVVPYFDIFLKPKGRFVVMMYTHRLYRNLRAASLADFAIKTEAQVDGHQNPWSEPYDAEKMQDLFGDKYKIVFEQSYNDDNYVMFELEKLHT